jgi:hypothetical protein
MLEQKILAATNVQWSHVVPRQFTKFCERFGRIAGLSV